jgi:hypothetical protein
MTISKTTMSALVRGAYDTQALRIEMGGRLGAAFRAKLGIVALEDDEDAERVIDKLRESYRRLTDGVADNMKLPRAKGFKGDEIISEYAELLLVRNYFELEKNEANQFKAIEKALDDFPIWTEYLEKTKGVGPAMGGIIVTYFDIHKATNVSKMWAYAGLDVAPDGRARGKHKEHLVERTYTKKDGSEASRVGLTYEPWLRARLLGVLGGVMLKVGSPWRKSYDDYKNRILTDPARIKCEAKDYQKTIAEHDPRAVWTPARVHKAAIRYMIKMFLADLWLHWRKLEGLPVTLSYNEVRRGRAHGEGRSLA